jgi:hypothetical protein
MFFAFRFQFDEDLGVMRATELIISQGLIALHTGGANLSQVHSMSMRQGIPAFLDTVSWLSLLKLILDRLLKSKLNLFQTLFNR